MLLAILCVAIVIQMDIRAMRFRAPGAPAEQQRTPSDKLFILVLSVIGFAGIVWDIAHRIH